MPEYIPSPRDWVREQVELYESSGGTKGTTLRDTGLPVASGRVTLVQEIVADKQAGFLIYAPVYRNDHPAEKIDDRRNALIGFVYAPFRAGDLLR